MKNIFGKCYYLEIYSSVCLSLFVCPFLFVLVCPLSLPWAARVSYLSRAGCRTVSRRPAPSPLLHTCSLVQLISAWWGCLCLLVAISGSQLKGSPARYGLRARQKRLCQAPSLCFAPFGAYFSPDCFNFLQSSRNFLCFLLWCSCLQSCSCSSSVINSANSLSVFGALGVQRAPPQQFLSNTCMYYLPPLIRCSLFRGWEDKGYKF